MGKIADSPAHASACDNCHTVWAWNDMAGIDGHTLCPDCWWKWRDGKLKLEPKPPRAGETGAQMDFLEAATNDELVDELARRFQHLVVAGVRKAPAGDEDDSFVLTYHGGITGGIGLCRRAARVLEDDAARTTRDIGPGDEP